MARALHNFNQDAQSWAGYFSLDDASGRIDYIYQYGFGDGSFTEEEFCRIARRCMKAMNEYYPTILVLAQE